MTPSASSGLQDWSSEGPSAHVTGSAAEGCTSKWKWAFLKRHSPMVIGLVPATAWQPSSRPSHISRQMNASPHKVAQDRIACHTCLSISSMTCQHCPLFALCLKPPTAVVTIFCKWAAAAAARRRAITKDHKIDLMVKSIFWLYKQCCSSICSCTWSWQHLATISLSCSLL